MRHRWWYLSGVGFAVLLVVGFMLSMGTLPEDSKAPDADWIKVISNSGDRAQIIVGAYILFVAGMLFLWFASTIRAALQSEEASSSVVGSVAAGSAIVFVAMLLAAAVSLAAVPASITFGNSPVPAADFVRQFSQLGTGFLLAPGSLAAAVFVASISRLGAVTGLFSRGLAVVGYVAAVLLLFGAIFLPFLALPIWAIVVGIALARRPVTPTSTERRTPIPSATPTHVSV